LRQLGLYREEKPSYVVGEPPRYTEKDLSNEMEKSKEFGYLVGDIQQRFGRILSNEELKILLSFVDYLGLPTAVVSILFAYCLQKSRQKGNTRPPSFHIIQKEAYRWAEAGIDTIEEAAGYVQTRTERQNQLAVLAESIHSRPRKWTPGEEKYLLTWLDLGFGKAEILLAYEKCCMKLGDMKWGYCNSIILSWHEQNLHTLAEINANDRGPTIKQKQKVPMGAGNDQNYGDLERQAIEKMKRDFG
ncbi:MAG: DnaD domain protein, partial [Eubacteriales bacterium]